MDYTVRDSTIVTHSHSRALRDGGDYSIRVGMVREYDQLDNGEVRYTVEVTTGGRQIPVSCVHITRFGGVHNFEEFILNPWAKSFPANLMPTASSASKFELRSGDVVLVAYLEGQAREGVILGGLSHPARKPTTGFGDIEYNSRFNGLETIINNNGSYKILFHGKAINFAELSIPPIGIPIPAPIYAPLLEGSYYGFSSLGSYVAADGNNQYLKIGKETKQVTIASGDTTITLSDTLGVLSVKTSKTAIKSDNVLIKATTIAADTITLSLKATQVAIGNDQIELIDGLSQLIDMLGTLVITSPTGTCLPFNTAPTWSSSIVPLKIKLMTLKTSLKQPGIDPIFELSADSKIDIS